jgi:hypothetical protein
MKKTTILGCVEYNEHPVPEALVRLTRRQWAEEFISRGTIRFGFLQSYRDLGNDVLGDSNDGLGMLQVCGHGYEVGSVNAVYASCYALPDISVERIRILANAGKYCSMIRINSPQSLIERIAEHACARKLWTQCGRVNYTRGAEVSLEELSSQGFHFNVFQKSARFSEDREFRVSLTNVNTDPEQAVLSEIKLNLGDCSDIAEVVDLSGERPANFDFDQ